jgi:hypothetical protein
VENNWREKMYDLNLIRRTVNYAMDRLEIAQQHSPDDLVKDGEREDHYVARLMAQVERGFRSEEIVVMYVMQTR